jgi:uncharacterized membrane protein
MDPRTVLTTAVTLVVLAVPLRTSDAGEPRYRLTQLTAMGPNGSNAAIAMNDAGVIVGKSSPRLNGTLGASGARPIRWHDGHPRVLPQLSGYFGVNNAAMDVNAHGAVVGGCAYPGVPAPFEILLTHATLWDQGGIRYLGALPGDVDCSATAINDAGMVVGTSGPAFYIIFGGGRAFLHDGASMHELPGFPGALDSAAFDINNAGVVVGTITVPVGFQVALLPVYWEDGQVHQLPLPAGAEVGRAAVINEAGVIAGAAGLPSPTLPDFGLQPARWVDGSPEWLPLPAGDQFGVATGINDAGEIVGHTGKLDPIFGFPLEQRPVLWTDQGVVDLTEAADLPAEWTFVFTGDVNNHGEICGSAMGSSPAQIAFLLSPIP